MQLGNVVQSSSIITVMAVGFVSSGLMNLTQAINVIIGSNILNAYEHVRAYYLNIAETLAGGKGN